MSKIKQLIDLDNEQDIYTLEPIGDIVADVPDEYLAMHEIDTAINRLQGAILSRVDTDVLREYAHRLLNVADKIDKPF